MFPTNKLLSPTSIGEACQNATSVLLMLLYIVHALLKPSESIN